MAQILERTNLIGQEYELVNGIIVPIAEPSQFFPDLDLTVEQIIAFGAGF
ncbi:hypothetical protein [Floridanema aerugineum]|uniref:Uncharacterized protein n=1 Tax=Floridaenema aerugineum BLCC-F46 TaxID=3153654 RepID=A0ABV4XET1_9CYAN